MASHQIFLTYLSASLLRLGYGDDPVSGIGIVLVNVVVLPLSIKLSVNDSNQQTKDEEERRKLYDKLKKSELKDKKKFAVAFSAYETHARDMGHPEAVSELHASLAALNAAADGGVARHPESVASSLNELMEVAEANESMMHGVVREMVERLNGVYKVFETPVEIHGDT